MDILSKIGIAISLVMISIFLIYKLIKFDNETNQEY